MNEISICDADEWTMKERPILFSGPMVKAILEGRKTQTRRVIKPVRGFEHNDILKVGMPYAADPWNVWRHSAETDRVGCMQSCPYGVPGDRLWVRETFLPADITEDGRTIFMYRATDPEPDEHTWRPSIHMYRAASRITLEITNVRVERVHEISEDDAIAEGICGDGVMYQNYFLPNSPPNQTPRSSFYSLWDSINAKRGFGWDANPWVWCVTFMSVSGL